MRENQKRFPGQSGQNRNGSNSGRNRLSSETSPYLLQHADNPVDWYPWGPEAFALAKEADKPIFLSIGYSTCHWCHVMERESFTDPEVARLMNAIFVNIKVDREERPDIDNVYMTVCQLLTGSGGWPLTIIMTPDREPFFAGTYFPPESRYGRIGMLELIPRIDEIWKTRRADALSSASRILESLQSQADNSMNTTEADLSESTLESAYLQLSRRFDERRGGFGDAPKFPTPHNLLFLLRYWYRTGEARALEMVEKTLGEMRRGGIFDHLGFGFHRYSTDSEWLLPHFEKMLYDQALLIMAHTETYQATGNQQYQQTAREIISYVMRDMTSPEGGFYSAEDADSEGEEGKFYLWSVDEIRQALTIDEADLAIRFFNVEEGGNFGEEATGRRSGNNILHQSKPIAEIADEKNLPENKVQARLEEARRKLFSLRQKRIRPHKDDKILTDWNGLMIASLAKAARVFDEPEYLRAASQAVDFILENMRLPDGMLLHKYRDGEAGITAHLDDYAFFIWGLIELYETNYKVKYLQTALEVNRHLMKQFWDDRNGGFFFSAEDGEELLVRYKDAYDGAVPSGNSAAMSNLLRLSRLTADAEFESKAHLIGRAFSNQVGSSPGNFTHMMSALGFTLGPAYEVVITGDLQSADTQSMLRALRQNYLPNKVVLLLTEDDNSTNLEQVAGFITQFRTINGKATAYVCQNYACSLPTTDIEQMLAMLKK